MVLDCGGGTADITMHSVSEIDPVLKLDELAPPSGGPFGSTYVDAEFETFLKDFVGAEAFGRLKPSGEWVQLMRSWETLKLGFDPNAEAGLETSKMINVCPILSLRSCFCPLQVIHLLSDTSAFAKHEGGGQLESE